jgi:formamidopyrimidine-DNA glycosylase
MPELAEVEFGRKVAHQAAVGRRITAAWCADDPIVFEGAAPAEVQAALQGRRVEATHRHGKHIWFALDRRPWPLFHFGMTGAFRVPGAAPLRLESGPERPDMAWPPRFAKLVLTFEDGGQLAMTSARRLARIRLRHDPPAEPPVSTLGFDPYLALPPLPAFAAKLAGRRGTLKGLLLDQGFAAGVGNWLADEVLYQARLDPRRTVDTLSAAEVGRLRDELQRVVATAVAADADQERFPSTWLFHHRWGKAAGAQVAGEAIEHITVAGRTTAWVPARQA